MTDKQINTCKFFDICEVACGGILEDTEMCPCYELYKHIARKEQECEELEKLYKELQDDMLSCNKCRATIKLQQQLDQLKQTIAEIKKIALGVRNYLAYPSPRDVRYEMDIILQKIRKCEVENETELRA